MAYTLTNMLNQEKDLPPDKSDGEDKSKDKGGLHSGHSGLMSWPTNAPSPIVGRTHSLAIKSRQSTVDPFVNRRGSGSLHSDVSCRSADTAVADTAVTLLLSVELLATEPS